MKLTHQTAIATYVQFVLMVVLGLVNAIASIISTCHSSKDQCVSNMIVSLILALLTAVWFGIILTIGYFAEKNRSNRLAGLLIICEIPTIIAAGLINFPRESNFLAKGTSLIDVVLGVIVIYLASQVLLARGRRIVKGGRNRNNL